LRALLDTSVLIALLDANHIHHRRALSWLQAHPDGWASCPITLNGCVRILSQPTYPNRMPMQTVVKGLAQAMQHPMHSFWTDNVKSVQFPVINWQKVLRPVDITDAYLLALAVKNQGCLVALHKGISWAWAWATQAQAQHLIVLA